MCACRVRTPHKIRSMIKVTGMGAAVFSAYSLCRGDEKFYNNVFMPVVRLIPPETAHDLAVLAVKWKLFRPPTADTERLRTQLLGMTFANPIGIAAGFDKHGEAVPGLHRIGFGFVEIGSVTPEPQPGNPRPRIFRLNEDKAIVNRYGFNSEGHDVVYERLRETQEQQQRQQAGEPGNRAVLGINLGKNKLSQNAVQDYVQGIRRFGALADYLVINVSSPNTPGLRTMQSRNTLQTLLTEVLRARDSLPATDRRPVLLKLAPDLSDEDLKEIVDVVQMKACAVDGLIVSNTTIDRPPSLKSVNAGQLGGLSGPPLKQRSTLMIAKVYKLTGGKIPIIGVGGIFTGEDAFEKIEAGASAVQLYTSFIFHGPPVVNKIKRELDRLLEQNGYANVQEAVGKGVDRFIK
ncbi:dihydroorotate dehydrogenase (quinone), mitochondrial-like [Anopheles albimanus]|uniref:dihydroorotate dehydrogenase (quinone), mitochondrial-like n=1 Tax=Anopheles albimanus TaxID=7167 RepID=UPI00163F0BF4|nr:dihydroorotate dehydrogenase (quinone), mitochondrial-like [Anopheles albimanus]